METASADTKVTNSHRGRGSSRRLQDNVTIVLFLAPAFALFLVFLVYPILRSVYYSLFDWNGLGPAVDFVGLGNFERILTDKVFMTAVANGLLIVVLSLVIQLPLALALALMVGRDLPGRAIYRTIFFLPYVLSEVITAVIWMSLLNPDPERGFVNALLILIPGVRAQTFLSDIHIVMLWVFRRPHLEILRTVRAAVHGRPAEYPKGNRRGCPY